MNNTFKVFMVVLSIISIVVVIFYSIDINYKSKPIIINIDRNILDKLFKLDDTTPNENVEIKLKNDENTIIKVNNVAEEKKEPVDTKEEIKKINEFYNTLASRERKVFSQNREDGVVEAIFDLLNIENLKKRYVELGTEAGIQCNTRYFREQKGWKGIMFDGGNADPTINLNKEIIHHNSVLQLFEKYKIEDDMDLLSEDTDYADYWIVQAILTKYKPKVLIHEINQQPAEKCVVVPKSNDLIYWDGSNYHGGSVCAFYCLAKSFDYSMVYCESAGVNCFWIRNDIIKKYLKFNIDLVQKTLNPTLLYKQPGFVYKETGRIWNNVSC